jgi:hypothetical protein
LIWFSLCYCIFILRVSPSVNSAGHQLGSFFIGFAAGAAPAVLFSAPVIVIRVRQSASQKLIIQNLAPGLPAPSFISAGQECFQQRFVFLPAPSVVGYCVVKSLHKSVVSIVCEWLQGEASSSVIRSKDSRVLGANRSPAVISRTRPPGVR